MPKMKSKYLECEPYFNRWLIVHFSPCAFWYGDFDYRQTGEYICEYMFMFCGLLNDFLIIMRLKTPE